MDSAGAGTRPLTTEEVIDLLRAGEEAMRSEFARLGEEVASWRPGPQEWSVKECLGHVIETEEHGFAGRIRRIMAEPGVFEPGWDQAAVQRGRNDNARPLRELVDEFGQVRSAGIQLVEGLLNADLVKICVHQTAGELSVEDLLHEWVFHDRNHFRQALANVQAYVFPSMGNAKKFSQPH